MADRTIEGWGNPTGRLISCRGDKVKEKTHLLATWTLREATIRMPKIIAAMATVSYLRCTLILI